MAFYTHVRATINGFETNEAIKDLTSLASPSPASHHWWGSIYYLQNPLKLSNSTIGRCSCSQTRPNQKAISMWSI